MVPPVWKSSVVVPVPKIEGKIEAGGGTGAYGKRV